MQLIVMKYFEDPRQGQSQFWASPRLSFHSCTYDIFNDWCSYSLWVTCVHVCRKCYNSRPTETLLQSSEHISIDRDKAARISVQQYQPDYYRCRGLRACRSIRRACVPWSLDHNWPLLGTVCLEYTQQGATYRRNKYHCWEVCYPVWRWHQKEVICCITSSACFNKESHYGDLMRESNFTLCIYGWTDRLDTETDRQTGR
jgi:hypothetical protein